MKLALGVFDDRPVDGKGTESRIHEEKNKYYFCDNFFCETVKR
jgi:hypothetical protein